MSVAEAAELLAAGPSAGEIGVFLAGAQLDARTVIYRYLLKYRRPGVSDELIGLVRRLHGDVEAAGLLPACSAVQAARLLPALAAGIRDWTSIAITHPDVMLDDAEVRLALGVMSGRLAWQRSCWDGVLAVAGRQPERVLGLLERHAPPDCLPGPARHYAALARSDHDRVIALLSTPQRAGWLRRAYLPSAVFRAVARADAGKLVPLARGLGGSGHGIGRLLRALPPARRGALWQAAHADDGSGRERPSDRVLALLPAETRAQETLRLLSADAVRADRKLTLHYTAFLPWDQARGLLAREAASDRIFARADGWQLMISCAVRSRDPDAVSEVIAALREAGRDDDWVRLHVARALTQAGRRGLQARDAAPLARLTAEMLAAPDTSKLTRDALAALATAVLGRHPDSPELQSWSLRMIGELFSGPVPELGRLDRELRRGQEQMLFAAVQPQLVSAIQHGRYQPVLAFARALGRRAARISELQPMLRQAKAGTQDTPRPA